MDQQEELEMLGHKVDLENQDLQDHFPKLPQLKSN